MKNDTLLKHYFSDNARYADLINGFAFGGQQVVMPEDLTEEDTTKEYGENGGRAGSRDLVRKHAFGVNFAVIGVENQSEVHYLMPLRVMEYDAGEYRYQARKRGRELREMVKKLPADERKKVMTAAEYLSRFLKNDRLQPCATFVLYYGEDWDGSRDLHGLLNFTDIPEAFQKFVNNYTMNLLEIRKLQDTDAYRTDLKQVFDFIRFSKDKKKLRELVEKDEAYRNLAEDAYDVAVAFTSEKELVEVKAVYEKEGKVDMCEALTEMLKDERDEGRQEGREEGRNGMLQLIARMSEAGESHLLSRLAKDEIFFQKMIVKYGIED